MGNGNIVAPNNKKTYIHLAVMVAIMIVIGNLPPFGQITPFGMKILGVFVGIVYGWCFVDIALTSFLGFFFIALAGYGTPLSGFAAGMGNTTIVTVLVTFVFAQCINEIGVSKAIAYWIMGKKFLVGKPWVLVIGMAVCSFVMSVLSNGIAAMFLLWQVTEQIAVANNIDKKDRELNMVYALVMYTAMTGAWIFPWRSGSLMFASFLTNAVGVTIPTVQWIATCLLYAVIVYVILLLIYRFVFRMKLTGFTMTEEMHNEFASYKMNKVEKVGLVALFIFIACLLFPSFFSGGIMSTLSSWGLVGMCILYVAIFVIWKDENGKPYADLDKCFKNGISWGILLLVVVTIPLCNAFESSEAGIAATLTAFFTNTIGGMDVNVLIVLIAVLVGVATQFMHNIVLAAVLIPIFAPIIINMGGNVITFFFAMFFTLQCAFGTPAGCMQAGFLFGKENISVKDAYMHGWLFLGATFIVVALLVPVMNMFFA